MSKKVFLPSGTRLPAYLRRTASSVLRFFGKENCGVEILLLEGGKMRFLKEKYAKKRTKDHPDVLAFADPLGFPHPEEKSGFLGEVYLDKELVRSDRQRGAFLLIHGLLHLLGYTHKGKSDTIKMEKMEKKLMEDLKS